jgi:hypothetical protein
MRFHVLHISVVTWRSIDIEGRAVKLDLRDFLIDGRPLAEHLGVSRCGLDLCGSPLDFAGQARHRVAMADYAQQLTGAAPGHNQFGSGRVVLYGCHCGCDYCGVLSTRVERSEGLVHWLDVGHEGERGARGTSPFTFRLPHAAAAVSGFLCRSCVRPASANNHRRH